MSHFSFLCRTKTSFGKNGLEHLPFDLSAMGSVKPMVIQEISDPKASMPRPLINAFKESGMTLGISPSLPEEDGEEAVKFIRSMYDIYTQKGYDAIMALGGEQAADMAKALNIAVTLGPEALKQDEITSPLSPLVYLPTGVETRTAGAGRTRFNGKTFISPFLAPDQVVMDPVLFIADDRATLLDSALVSLATGCEIFVSQNPAAKAYATTIIQLVLPPLKALMASGLDPEENLAKRQKQEQGWQKTLVQASVLTGYLMSQNPIGPVMGQKISAKSRVTPGHAMAILLPSILEFGPSPDLADLLLPLAGPGAFSAIPGSQQPFAALHAIHTIINDLYRISGGKLPRSLEEAGWNKAALTALGREIREETKDLADMDLKFIDSVLPLSGSGHSAARP